MDPERVSGRPSRPGQSPNVYVKRYPHPVVSFYGVRHPRYERELRVGRLLERQPPGVPFARVLSHDRARGTLTFEAIDGEVVGPKYPEALAEADVVALAGFGDTLSRYRPRRARFLHRFNLGQRLAFAERFGVLDVRQREVVRSWFADDPPRYRFAHGDITARNVMRSSTGELVLIDWELAGWYPQGWDRAFFWYSLAHVPGARASVGRDQDEWFWRCAFLVETLHIGMLVATAQQATQWYPAQVENLHRLWLTVGNGGSGSGTFPRSGSG